MINVLFRDIHDQLHVILKRFTVVYLSKNEDKCQNFDTKKSQTYIELKGDLKAIM